MYEAMGSKSHNETKLTTSNNKNDHALRCAQIPRPHRVGLGHQGLRKPGQLARPRLPLKGRAWQEWVGDASDEAQSHGHGW